MSKLQSAVASYHDDVTIVMELASNAESAVKFC